MTRMYLPMSLPAFQSQSVSLDMNVTLGQLCEEYFTYLKEYQSVKIV